MRNYVPVRFVPVEQLPGDAAYCWRLYRFKHMKRLGRSGMLPEPADILDSGCSAQAMAAQLNAGCDFGFAYEPADRDVLVIINADKRSQFLSFRFDKEAWRPGASDPNWEVLEVIGQGEAVFAETKNQ